MTPEVVLKASGHVDRFTDFMVTDAVTHDCHRADHLLEAALEARLADAKAPPSAEEREVRHCCAFNAWRCHLHNATTNILSTVHCAGVQCRAHRWSAGGCASRDGHCLGVASAVEPVAALFALHHAKQSRRLRTGACSHV